MQIHELPSGTPTDADFLPFDTGSVNYKTPFSGFDLKENTATFTSADEADPAQFKTVDPIETGPIKTILNRLSMAISNVRYIWKVLSALVSKMSNYEYYGDTSQSYRISSGDDYFYMNHTEGYFDIKMNNGTHRLLIHQGNASNHEAGQLRVGNLWFIADATDQVMAMRFSGTQYISISGDPSIKRVYLMDGDTKLYLDDVDKRVYITATDGIYLGGVKILSQASSETNLYNGNAQFTLNRSTNRATITASGGLVVNGYLGWSGTFKDQTGKTVTVHNGIITNVA